MASNAGKRPKVFVTRKDVPQNAIDLLKSSCEITQYDGVGAVPRAVLKERVAEVDGLFCLLTDKIDGDLLDVAKKLKVIGTMSVGYDHIDVKECQKRGVLLGNTPDVLTEATAELTVALLLCTARRLTEAADEVRNGGWGTWNPLWMCGKSLQGSTIGILGLGRIGLSVAKKLLPFEPAKLIYYNRSEQDAAATVNAEYVSMDKLLSESDFLIITCALTTETRQLFNKKTFAQMKNDAILINTSRGPIVCMDDLFEALSTGQIGAAGLDVTDPEPLPTDHRLLTLKNCVVLPHIGSATVATRMRMASLAAENILAGLSGQPLPASIY
uniref:Glyoxylate reductase/hydroxypyruvate reductase n=1 Tax=Plectus sambesii TaxID=2011161 RepID=A0A914XEC2_9BILA